MYSSRLLGILTLTTAVLAGGPSAHGQNVLRLKQVAVHDSAMKQEAFRVLAPSDWRISGDVIWRMHATYPSTAYLTARAPAGVEEIRFYPDIPMTDGVREAAAQNAAIAGPDAMRLAFASHPEGSNYLGSEVRRVCPTPADYLQRILLPRMRADIRQYDIIAREDMPEWAKTSNIVSGSGGVPAQARAGRVRIAYQKDGKTIHEDFFVMLAFVKFGPLTGWGAEVAASVRGEKGNLEFLGKVFQTMMQSFRVDLKWFANRQQIAETLQNIVRQQQRQVMVIANIVRDTNEQISNIHRNVYRRQQESQDRRNLAFSQYIRGVEEYKTPFDTRPVELPSGYKHAWANRLGEFVLTDDANFDPNRQLTGTWDAIERRR